MFCAEGYLSTRHGADTILMLALHWIHFYMIFIRKHYSSLGPRKTVSIVFLPCLSVNYPNNATAMPNMQLLNKKTRVNVRVHHAQLSFQAEQISRSILANQHFEFVNPKVH